MALSDDKEYVLMRANAIRILDRSWAFAAISEARRIEPKAARGARSRPREKPMSHCAGQTTPPAANSATRRGETTYRRLTPAVTRFEKLRTTIGRHQNESSKRQAEYYSATSEASPRYGRMRQRGFR